MNKLYAAVVFVFLFVTAGCTPIHTKAQYNKNTDFTRYKTFSFVPMRAADDTSIAFSPINQETLNGAITKEMEARHFRRVEKDPDLMISNYIAVDDKQKVVANGGNFYSGFYGGYNGYGRMGYDTIDYEVGKLVVDLVDTKLNHLVWEGIATKTLMEQPTFPEKTIDRAVAKIFEKFPVKPAK